jgi:hypothetical protein
VIHAARDAGRQVCFVGRSMVRNMPIARELGYLDYDDDQIVELGAVDGLEHDRIVIVCTGSQGEPYAALSLMAAGQHRQITIEPGDTVVGGRSTRSDTELSRSVPLTSALRISRSPTSPTSLSSPSTTNTVPTSCLSMIVKHSRTLALNVTNMSLRSSSSLGIDHSLHFAIRIQANDVLSTTPRGRLPVQDKR